MGGLLYWFQGVAEKTIPTVQSIGMPLSLSTETVKVPCLQSHLRYKQLSVSVS